MYLNSTIKENIKSQEFISFGLNNQLKRKEMKTCGLDVHKDSVFCAIHDGKTTTEVKSYPTLTNTLREMGEYLMVEGVEKIAMESTGIYWIPVWNILESMSFELILVNPYLIKQMPGRKSDVKDAQWIATLLNKGLLRGSLVPNETIRELRCYSRKYVKLQGRITSLLQEMERTLEMCNIRITSFVSNISGKSISKVINAVIEGETSAVKLEELVHRRIRNKHQEKIRESLEGFITPHHRFTLELLKEEYELLLEQADRVKSKMQAICYAHYSREMDLLVTLPGVDTLAAMLLIAETGADMKAFESSGKFAGWTGLRPRNDESAGKYKSTATTKGNKYLRSVLVQIAWGASRTKGSFFMERYTRLAMRKSRKKALVAIARKITVVIWNLLSRNEAYNPGLVPVYDPAKLSSKISYHQKEIERLENLKKK
ncbi:IS110 family transposase [Bacteroidia bacterium]|nr:IS110 family transposase [Bacteroidia bacterium]GHT70758.1 IS110 family transposase [Bacteroidia bacterium]GHV20973.1 IS110 family transposase [Bacteroidia bacterium]